MMQSVLQYLYLHNDYSGSTQKGIEVLWNLYTTYTKSSISESTLSFLRLIGNKRPNMFLVSDNTPQ